MAESAEAVRSPGINFPPPLLFVVAIAAGWGIEMQYPLPLNSLLPISINAGICWVLVIGGFSLMIWGLATFKLARTAIYPNQPAGQLVAKGPYQFSRNPMYVGLVIMTIGIALLADNAWMLLMLPVVLTILSRFVIRREEKYLQHEFGSSYTDYAKRVRRWI